MAHNNRWPKAKVTRELEKTEAAVASLADRVDALREKNAVMEERNKLLDKYLELSPEPLPVDDWWIDARTQAALERSVGLGENVTFTADQTRPLQLSRSQVAGMTFDTYRTMWKALVEAGSAGLLACGGLWDPASAAGRRLRQLSDESGELRVALALSHPTRLTSYHYAMGQDESRPEQREERFWWKLALQLAITPQQVALMLRLRESFLRRTEAAQQQRRAAAAQLAASVPQGDGNLTGGSRYLSAVDGAQRLQSTLREDYANELQMEVALFKLCLNPVQSARSKALAYPLYPDALAIINAVAEAAGAPVAAQLMLRPPDPGRKEDEQQPLVEEMKALLLIERVETSSAEVTSETPANWR